MCYQFTLSVKVSIILYSNQDRFFFPSLWWYHEPQMVSHCFVLPFFMKLDRFLICITHSYCFVPFPFYFYWGVSVFLNLMTSYFKSANHLPIMFIRNFFFGSLSFAFSCCSYLFWLFKYIFKWHHREFIAKT